LPARPQIKGCLPKRGELLQDNWFALLDTVQKEDPVADGGVAREDGTGVQRLFRVVLMAAAALDYWVCDNSSRAGKSRTEMASRRGSMMPCSAKG